MGRSAIAYVIDPRDPRAPPQSVWDQLDEAERRRVLEMLPSEIERAEPPEGDAHSRPKHRARETLDEHFRRIGRRIYLASELPVYYPDEPMFAPDLLAVRDAEPHERDHWTVSHEGLDLVVEIHVRGSASNDFERNVERYARLGIPEYFAYAPRRGRLAGWRLPEAGARSYQPLVPQAGRWHSQILDLDLALDEGQLRFYYGSAALLDARELIARLSTMVDRATERAEQEAQRAEQEAQRAEQEAQRAEQEAQRAEQEAQRAERYAARLREAGIDPDEPIDRGGSSSG